MKTVRFIVIALFALSSRAYSQNQFNNEVRWTTQVGSTTNIVGDFNGDGMTDVGYYAGNGEWYVMLSLGNSFGAPSRWAVGSAVNNGTWAGDFNGDGLCDKITYVNSPGGDQWKGFWIALSGRETNITPPTIPYYRFYNDCRWSTQTVDFADKILVGDYNADAKDDIAYYKYDATYGGQWYVMLSNGGTFTCGTGSFSSPTRWISGFAWNDGTWVGDFNGDGRADIVTQVYSTTPNDFRGWWVGLAQASGGFSWAGRWNSEQGSLTGVIVGDFNGDSKADIAYHVPSNGTYPDCWRVMLSTGSGFSASTQWSVGQAINNGVWAGDFNGDGLCDKVTHVNSTAQQWKGWWVAMTNDARPREVGVWYTLWYPCIWDTKDPAKTPVAGWGTDAVSGNYTLEDTAIIHKQIRAMKKANIDFMVVDLTNGFDPTGWPRHGGDGCTTGKLTKLFNLTDGLRNSDTIKVAVGLGFEFWGRYHMCGYFSDTLPGNDWDTWQNQNARQRTAVNTYLLPYTTRPSYYRYLTKPLLIAVLGGMIDYPFRNENFEITSRQKFPNYTVRYGAEWGATYAGWPENWQPCIACVESNRYPYVEGTDSKRLWSWGAGAKETSSNHSRALPVSTELMCIMPGTQNYTKTTDMYIDRHAGDYYMNAWKQVIAAMPKKVLIADWNNWNEESAIEGCVGDSGWKDYYGTSQYDWYLQITQVYSSIFKTETVPNGAYVRDANHSAVYLMNNGQLIYRGEWPQWKPAGKPVILLPQNWLNNHYFLKQAVNEKANPIRFDIQQNYPNPFNPSTKISYSLPENLNVKIVVFDLLGRKVETLINEEQEPGEHSINFDAGRFAGGIYFYRIQAGQFVQTKKMVLIK